MTGLNNELIDEMLGAEFDDAASEIFFILAAAHQLRGDCELNNAVHLALDVCMTVREVTYCGLPASADWVGRVSRSAALLAEEIMLKKDTAAISLVAGLMTMALSRSNEFENDWEMLVTEELRPLPRNA